MTKRYMAIAVQRGEFTVGMVEFLDIKPLGSVQYFKMYEEADECARRIASGEFEEWSKGIYVSNR